MTQSGIINTMDSINSAEIVHTKAREIHRYWMRHFHSNQYKYINACLMYGFYLEVVQALPMGGAQLLRKAYMALNNKWHLNKDLVDIIKKKNAVIVASIMPETLGKIIETSASAKDLFNPVWIEKSNIDIGQFFRLCFRIKSRIHFFPFKEQNLFNVRQKEIFQGHRK